MARREEAQGSYFGHFRPATQQIFQDRSRKVAVEAFREFQKYRSSQLPNTV